MATVEAPTTIDLAARFPSVVTADARPGYAGFIVEKDNLVEVATAIRDEFGFESWPRRASLPCRLPIR